MDKIASDHLYVAATEMGIAEDVLGLGVWLDGVACKWSRSTSVELVTMSLPGMTGKWRDLRIPLAALGAEWVAKDATFDDILEVISWSLKFAALDVAPPARHDGSPWRASDSQRKAAAGKPLGCPALLCQVTGDWKMYKQVFRFPQHNEVRGCCFKCRATPLAMRRTDPDADWRGDRLTHWDLLARMRAQGLTISPLFSAPGVKSGRFRLDWLHIVDLGGWGGLAWPVICTHPAEVCWCNTRSSTVWPLAEDPISVYGISATSEIG